MSEWIHKAEKRSAPGAIAWVSLDEGDNDPTRFLTYLSAALEGIDESFSEITRSLGQSPQPSAMEVVLTQLLNMVAELARSATLVLDDYHLISTPAIHEGLGFLLEHLPQNMHLAMATRADPPLPTFRLRARGQLAEIRSDDLRFSPDEAATFLNTVMGLNLATKDMEALEARTEGWIVGLQLAALSLQGRVDAHEYITAFSGSHHYILEYLTEEVVRCQPETVQQFLMQTSILGRLCGPLCDAVCSETLEPAGETMLSDLQRRNLFIVPLDDDHRWYRYHHLFGDLLGNLRRREQSPEQIAQLHRRASNWFEQNESLDDAIKHALEAQDYEHAAALIEQAASGALSQGRLATLLQWIEALPPAKLSSHPRLLLQQGWALHLSGQGRAAEQILQGAKARLQTMPPSADNLALRGELAALLTGVATLSQDTTKVIELGQEALDYLPEDKLVPRARVYVALGTAYAYENNMEQATHTWQQARDLALQAGNPFLATAAIEVLAGLKIYHLGRLHEAAQTLHQVLEMGTTSDGARLPFTATAHILLAEIYLEWNDVEAASSYLTKGAELLNLGGIGYSLTHSYCTRSRLDQAKGDTEGALKTMRAAEQAVQGHSLLHFIVHQAACQVRLRLYLGDFEGALMWAQSPQHTTTREMPERLPAYLHEVQQISLARVHLAQGKTKATLAALTGIFDQAQHAGRMAHVIEISLLQALAMAAQMETRAAVDSLRRAVTLAEPEGFVQTFLEKGIQLQSLLVDFRQGLDRQQSKGETGTQDHLLTYTDKLLVAFSKSLPKMDSLHDQEQRPRAQKLPEPLTEREMEVLSLICQGHSNQQIVERLVVTLHTVKKHSSNIYGKLGVKSRAQAIVRARELGLC